MTPIRAFVIGLALGVTTSVAGGCAPPLTCSPANCDGCCTNGTTCVLNTSSNLCGAKGSACTSCPAGLSCSPQGTCGTPGPDGGFGGGGGFGGSGGFGGGTSSGGSGGSGSCSVANCNGCCANGTCLDFAQQSAANCGSGGQVCLACNAGNSCSSGVCSSSASCSPSNCPSGCCQGNTCLSTSQQTTSACGKSGAVCAACGSGKTCSAGSCVTTSSCATTCSGCCYLGSCISTFLQSETTCGKNGATCASCTGTQTCNAGVCSGTTATGALGDPCVADSDCINVPTTTGGGTPICKKTTLPGGATYTGGYCTRRCTADQQCGITGFCSNSTLIIPRGEIDNICLKECAAVTDCRATGYSCYQVSPDPNYPINGCWIKTSSGGPPPIFDAGVGAAPNLSGSTCSVDATCQPPAYGFCRPGTLSDGGVTAYTGGSCTADCTLTSTDPASNYCGTGGRCVLFAFNLSGGPYLRGRCEQACPPNGPTVCRSGYRCAPLNGAPDAGICYPKCTNPGFGSCGTGSTCNTTTGACQ